MSMITSTRKMMVSIIVLSYNHEKFICQALESILMQKVNFNYEILVGDDASTDRTQNILKEYEERYPEKFRVFYRKDNLGATKNSYELLTNAKGKYLATCEGDDFWTDPNKLQLQVDFLESHPEYIGCTHKFTIVDENNKLVKNQKLNWIKHKKIFSIKDFDGIRLPGQTATFVRKNIFLNPQHDYSIFYKANPMIGDRTMILFYLLQGDIFCLPRNMSCYRQISENKENITNKIYSKKAAAIQTDFSLTNILEEYARQEFGMTLNFCNVRSRIFTDSVLLTLQQPKLFGWTFPVNIIQRFHKKTEKFICVFLCPFLIIYKIFYKLILKRIWG